MKKTFIYITIALFTLNSCNEEFTDPTKTLENNVLKDSRALINMSNGLQKIWSVGKESSVYTSITANGFSSKELRIINVGNFEENQFNIGGGDITNTNSILNRLWSNSLIINSEANKILNNLNAFGETQLKERISTQAQATIFKALAMGTLTQFFERVPLETKENAAFNTKQEVLENMILELKKAETAIDNIPINPQNNQKIFDIDAPKASGFLANLNFKNTIYALIARYSNMLGLNNQAIEYANKVNLTARSTFYFDAKDPNPIASSSIRTNNVYQPVDFNFGLSSDLIPNINDKRRAFYIRSSTDNTPLPLAVGFFDQDSKLIPIYLPSEMTLIKAEAYARNNDLTNAVSELNKILTKKPADDIYGIGADLTGYSGPNTQVAILTEIYKNRCIELYMSGLKLEDSKRFNRPQAERSRNFYPYPASERNNNTNIPSDPAL